MAASMTGKRKRNQVSYAIDEYFDNIEMDAAIPVAADSDDVQSDADNDGDDTTFGARKSRGKGRPKKKCRLTKAKKPKKEKPFRFLDLPAELRDEIYELALTDVDGLALVLRTKSYRRVVARGVIEVEGGSGSSSYYYGKKRRQSRWARYYDRNNDNDTDKISAPVRSLVPNLLATCQQIRAEGGSYLYKQEIILEDMTALQTFVAQIGQYNRDMLTDITVKGWGTGRGVHKGNNYSAFCLLASCTGLKELFLDCALGWYRNPKQLATQIFRDGHYFLEAYAAANGGIDAAVNLIQLDEEWHFDSSKRSSRYGHYNYGREDNGGNRSKEAEQSLKEEFQNELRALMSR
ncbi:hypothetical protein DOTSEDRAFT_79145 [Dothistroma septosporum NZE10]|uniref:2EXR domain-containing protein n=1 Tax=Dothistroma septosporum (strain NZE10 / CBS 128990) TaxID=675120 RepID=N1PPX7_DOTSN|nr:hypothetical protein DOTSEDRAFT_79145 [Dothistroma septosporum NZE10]